MSPSQPKPLHERLPVLGWIREPLRRALFGFLRKALETDDGRELVRRSVLGPERPGGLGLDGALASPAEYPELARAVGGDRTSLRSDVVFITARFRSGSTLLWNLFRNLEGCTAYYEPFNERRWFDPQTRGAGTDPSHQHVTDYWKEYVGLEELGQWFRADWHDRDLYLPAGAWRPRMKRFLERMIERSPQRPVLQFNRMDLRLPWLRQEFPNATVLHLYRHPRDQWVSSLIDPKGFGPRDAPERFRSHDHFYLQLWVTDLKRHFPFLEEAMAEHPYRAYYFLWKLSYLFGRRYGTRSLSFESVVADPRASLGPVLEPLGVAPERIEPLAALVEPPRLGRWKEWADNDWFRHHEEACETVLAEFLAGTA